MGISHPDELKEIVIPRIEAYNKMKLKR